MKVQTHRHVQQLNGYNKVPATNRQTTPEKKNNSNNQFNGFAKKQNLTQSITKDQTQVIDSVETITHKYEVMMKQNQMTINQLEAKVKKLQQQNKRLQEQLHKKQKLLIKSQQQVQELKEQSRNLHRLNQTKYTQITELKRQIQQQQSFLEEQVSVIEQLQKTVVDLSYCQQQQNQSGMINITQIENGENDKNDKNEFRQNKDNLILQQYEREQLMELQLVQKGKMQAWSELLQQVEEEIIKLTENNSKKSNIINGNKNSNYNPKEQSLQNQQAHEQEYEQQGDQFQLSSIMSTNRYFSKNHEFDDQQYKVNQFIGIDKNAHELYQNDGIEQIQLSFCQHMEEQPTILSLNNHLKMLEGQQEDEKDDRYQVEKYGFRQTSPVQGDQSKQFQTSMAQQYSFISNNPHKYLETIEMMTQQLTQAYHKINQLQQQVTTSNFNKNIIRNNSLTKNQNNKLTKNNAKNKQSKIDNKNTLSFSPNPQSIVSVNIKEQNNNNKKKKPSHYFNLSFWK